MDLNKIVDKQVLTISEIKFNIMRGVKEPMIEYNGAFVYLVAFFSFIAAFHWIGEVDTDLYKEPYNYSKVEVAKFEYNGKVDDVIGGMPAWCFATLMWTVVGAICGVYAATLWKDDDGKVNGSKASIPMEPVSDADTDYVRLDG